MGRLYAHVRQVQILHNARTIGVKGLEAAQFRIAIKQLLVMNMGMPRSQLSNSLQAEDRSEADVLAFVLKVGRNLAEKHTLYFSCLVGWGNVP